MTSSTDDFTINSRLNLLSKEGPERPAFIFLDKDSKRTVLSRHDVWDKSGKCAAFFRRHGIEKGDIVCNTLVNSQERLISTYGVILAGAISMHGQTFLADGEDLVKNLEDSRCKAIIINPDEKSGANVILKKLKYKDGRTGIVRYKGLPNLSQVIYVGRGDKYGHSSWLESLGQEMETYEDCSVKTDDVAVVFCTSGSTGFAKLIPHTHRRLQLIGRNIQKLWQLNQDSILFNDRSLGWMGGSPLIYPLVGLTRVLIDLSPGQAEDNSALILHILETENCDKATILPNDIQRILDHLDSVGRYKLPKRLRIIGTGGGPISKVTMKAIGRISESITNVYGTSEFGLTHGLNVTDESQYENACCGDPCGHTEVKIVDENLLEVVTGEPGELLVRGPSLFTGYLNKSDVTKDVITEDGWFRTSDVGYKNGKGQLFVLCRKTNAINYKGIIHYPGWMEAKLEKHPDIKKSIVLGVPDPVVHEQICVCIIKAPNSMMTVEDIKEYFKSLFLTSETSDITPIPKYFLFFDQFPLNINGKIDRTAVKKVAWKRLEVEPSKP